MSKLTQKALEAIGPEMHGKTVREDGGLLGKVRLKGDQISIYFYYRYRWEAKTRDLSCGTWPTDSLVTIRKIRDEARLKVAKGIDPGEQKKVIKIEAQEAIALKLAEQSKKLKEELTFTDMFEAWIDNGVRREDGNATLKRTFSSDVLPFLGKKKVCQITESDLIHVLKKMVDRGVNRSAVLMNNNFKQMFSWAEKRQPWRKLMLEGNPADLVEIKRVVSEEYDIDNVRTRILSDEEIAELAAIFMRQQTSYEQAENKRAAQRPVVATTQLAIWIMLSTLCRVGELSSARWEDIDFDKKTWFIPKDNVKNKVASLNVYLSDFSLEQFKQLYQLTRYSEWCFPDSTGNNFIGRKVIADQVSDRQFMFKVDKNGEPTAPKKNRKNDNSLVLADGNNGKWTPHDLRRTGSTIMQKLRISIDTINRCQNHVTPGGKVNRHYLHHEYEEETRDAWQALGLYLEGILSLEKNT